MSTVNVLMVVGGGLLIFWALTEFQLIGKNKSLARDDTGKRIPGGYTSPVVETT